jgi:translation initiation factor 2 alpha subunit (eIF-2alpha)
MGTDISDEEVMREVTEKLEAKYPHLNRDDIQAVVSEEFSALAGRPVRDYLAVLTERAAKKRLKASKAAL